MKILIAGYGEVGATLARQLSSEGYDLTLLDSDPQVLETGMERYDVMAVQGNCASMEALRRAGIKKTNLLIACTGSDELNLLSCMTAHSLNPYLHTIARIRDPEYLEQVYAMRSAFGISMTFNPEQYAAIEMGRLLRYPGFLTRESFMGGRVELAELRVDEGSRLCNVALSDLDGIIRCQVLVCVVLRDGNTIVPNGNLILRSGDRVFVTAPSDNLAMMLKNLGIVTHKARKVMIAGGGNVAYYLAKQLKTSRSISIQIIESDPIRCQELTEQLPFVRVIQGNPGDREFLESRGISSTDAFVSLTDVDEQNIIASLFANSRGVPQILTKLGCMEDSRFVDDLPIGSVLSPARLCCNIILRYVRAMHNQDGAATAVYSIADGQAEAIEFAVDSDTLHCGQPLRKIKFKENVRIACILRGNNVIVPNGDSFFNEGDRLVVVVNGDAVMLNLNDIFA